MIFGSQLTPFLFGLAMQSFLIYTMGCDPITLNIISHDAFSKYSKYFNKHVMSTASN